MSLSDVQIICMYDTAGEIDVKFFGCDAASFTRFMSGDIDGFSARLLVFQLYGQQFYGFWLAVWIISRCVDSSHYSLVAFIQYKFRTLWAFGK